MTCTVLLGLAALGGVRAHPFAVDRRRVPHPVVIWHGMGDSAYSAPMQAIRHELEQRYPGIYVHLIALHPTLREDRQASLLGNVNEQVEEVYRELQTIPALQHGFDAVGLSQGGQFLRAYVERYNTPRVRNLITFGSQHMGIADLPACRVGDIFCHTLHRLAAGHIYSDYAQNSVVAAQYFRDTRSAEQFALYKEKNHFLLDINNEGEKKNATYKANLARLDRFVLILFAQDTTVVPSVSSVFGAMADPDEQGNSTLVSMRETELYQNDWIGLQALDAKGALQTAVCDGRHMEIDTACFEQTFGTYVGRPYTAVPPLAFPLSCVALVCWLAFLLVRRLRTSRVVL